MSIVLLKPQIEEFVTIISYYTYKYTYNKPMCLFYYSSANAKKWEVELATLKSNNLRLTAALQESTANVDEWKRQLHQYREEVARARHYAGKGKAGKVFQVDSVGLNLSNLILYNS